MSIQTQSTDSFKTDADLRTKETEQSKEGSPIQNITIQSQNDSTKSPNNVTAMTTEALLQKL